MDKKYDQFAEDETSKFVKNKFKGPFKKFLADNSPLRMAKRALVQDKRGKRDSGRGDEMGNSYRE